MTKKEIQHNIFKFLKACLVLLPASQRAPVALGLKGAKLLIDWEPVARPVPVTPAQPAKRRPVLIRYVAR